MHGGARWFDGRDDIAGFAGPGVGGGSDQAACGSIGYALDFGADANVAERARPGVATQDDREWSDGLASTGDIFAAAPYVMLSGRLRLD